METISPILAVKDVNAVLEYWDKKLGFTIAMTMSDDATDKTIHGAAQYGAANIMLAPTDDDTIADATGKGIILYLHSDRDIDAYYEQVKNAGANISEEPADMFWGDRCFSVQDPAGITFQFSQTVAEMQGPPEGHSVEFAAAASS